MCWRRLRMERAIVEKIIAVGMVVDRKRHAKCWSSLQKHFLANGKATLQPVDTDAMMDMRKKMGDRVETRVLIDNVFAEPRAEFTIYVFHGVGVSNLHLLRTSDHAWAFEMLFNALDEFRTLIQHPAEVPEIMAYACQALDPQWYPHLHFPALQWTTDLETYIPWLSPSSAMWADTVVHTRYAYYVPTIPMRERRDPLDYLEAYLQLSQEASDDTSLPPPPMLVAPLDNRVDMAKERAKEHTAVQATLSAVIEAADVDMDLFYESINRAHAIQRGLDESRLITEAVDSIQNVQISQEPSMFDLNLEAALSERSMGDICPEEDAISRQLYSNLAWNMGTKPLINIMTEKQGSVERYSTSAKAMKSFPNIESSYQLSAAAFATINRVLSCIQRQKKKYQISLYCTHCRDLRNTYRRLRALLTAFPGDRPDMNRSFMDSETCVACATILCLCSAVLCYGCDLQATDRTIMVDKYLVRALGLNRLPAAFSVDKTFIQAMHFFRHMDEAVDQQRRPWSFRYDYHPVLWDGATASFRHSPTACCDESLTVTALVLRSLTKMGGIDVDLYENAMHFPNSFQKEVVDNCFTPCIDFFMDQSTVTETTKAKTKLSRSEVGVCVDRAFWKHTEVTGHRPSISDRHYLYTESLCEFVDTVATTGENILHEQQRPHVGLEDLRHEYTLAWPLMVRNFIHGAEDTAAAGGDLRLYYSVYGLQKMLFSKWTRGQSGSQQATMVAPVSSGSVSVKIYSILPELLSKVLLAYPSDVHVFDLLVEPLLMAARKVDTPLEEGESVSVKITTDATWTLYTALWAFVHALSERMIIIDTVLERLHQAFCKTRRLREEHPVAYRLCTYLYQQSDQCRKDGHFHVPNPFHGKRGNTAVDARIHEICAGSCMPPHHLLYRAVLSDHIDPGLARDVFLGISSRLHWRSRPGLSASLAFFADPCASVEAKRTVNVLASLRRAYTVYEEYSEDMVELDGDDTYTVMAELFASLEVLTRFPSTIYEEDRLDIVERNCRLGGAVDIDRHSTYRGLISRAKALSLTMFKNHASLVCSRSTPLLGSWLEATPWAQELSLKATEVMPVWRPMLLPTHLDHYRLLNVVRGSGELAPFTGSHPDFLMAVITEPIEAVTIPPTSDFGLSLMQKRVYGMTELEAQQWTKAQIASTFFKGRDLVPVSLDSASFAGHKRSRGDGGDQERPVKRQHMSPEAADINTRLQRLRESGNGPSVVFVPRNG